MPQAKPIHSTSTRSRDPIFALIRDHKRLCKKADAAADAEGRLEQKLQKLEPKRYPSHNPVTSTTPRILIGNAWFMGSDEEIAKHVRYSISDTSTRFGPRTAKKIRALSKGAERELQDMLKATVEAHERRRRKAGLTMAALKSEAAAAAERDALRRLFQTKPTTPAGAAALLAYVKKLHVIETTYYALDDDTVLDAMLNAAALSKAA